MINLRDTADAHTLLVAMDFDGTLAHFDDSPTEVRAIPGVMEVLEELATLPRTTVLLLSGRDVQSLSIVSEQPIVGGEILLAGTHGAEPGERVGEELASDQKEKLQQLQAAADNAAGPGMWVELKPYSVGLHYRTAEDPDQARDLVRQFQRDAAAIDDVHVTDGRDILEAAVVATNKGSYLQELRDKIGADAVVFAGDDVTDETVLRRLDYSRDIGIHVGGRLADSTAAQDFLAAPEDVREFLEQLLNARRAAVSAE